MGPSKKRPAPSRESGVNVYDWDAPREAWDADGPMPEGDSEAEEADPTTWSTAQAAQVAADYILGLKTEGIFKSGAGARAVLLGDVVEGRGTDKGIRYEARQP